MFTINAETFIASLYVEGVWKKRLKSSSRCNSELLFISTPMKYQVSFHAKIWYLHMWTSHVKISPLLWLHDKLRPSHQKAIKVKWFGISLVFIWWIEHYMAAWRYKISLRVLKNIFSTLEEKFRNSKRPCNILYVWNVDSPKVAPVRADDPSTLWPPSLISRREKIRESKNSYR